MVRDFYTEKLLQINIHSRGRMQDFHVEQHYHEIKLQAPENCCSPIGFSNVLKFTKNVGRKCMNNSLAMAHGALTWIKIAIKKPKFKKKLEKDKDKVTLQLLRNDIQEIKQLVKELQKHKCLTIAQETAASIRSGGPVPPPPPPPLPVQIASKVLPRPPVRRCNTQATDIVSRPPISLEDLLKVKLKKPSERKFQLPRRKFARNVETSDPLQQVNLRPMKTASNQSASCSIAEEPQSPVSSLKRLLTNSVDGNKFKRRRS